MIDKRMLPPVWTSLSITTLAISLVALTASLTSLWFGWRNHLRAEAQDRRRKPALSLDLRDARILPSPSGRFYCFHIQVKNPSDTDNAISLIELRVIFTMPSGAALIAKIAQVDPALFPVTLGEALSPPVKVGAHNIVTGWCVFELQTALVGDKAVESYEVHFHDTHALSSTIAPRVIQPAAEISA